MKACVLLAVLASAGCASGLPTVEEQIAAEYRHETTRIETIEEFNRRKATCARSGGYLQVRRLSHGRQPPTLDEMKTATCERISSLF